MIDLRDHFAAAALTGLLAQGDDGSFSEESYTRAAYRWADAMLRHRVTNPLPEALGGIGSVTPRVSTGETGNQWFTIPPPPRKLDEEATLPP